MKYKLLDFIGNGKFGKVYKGQHTETKKYVAVKIETNSVKLLKHETTILNYLYHKKCKNIPVIFWYGIQDQCPTLVMTYFERKLTPDYFHPYYFSKILSVLENIHNENIVHRDIKPSNFMLDEKMDIHLIDFGFATFYSNENKEKKYIVGTPSFVSIRIHEGNEATRRDDLISLGYTYLYLCPYLSNPLLQDIETTESGNYDSVMHIHHPYLLKKKEGKKWKNLSPLVREKTEIFNYLEYCYALEYNEKPDYSRLRELLCGGSGATS